MFGGESIPKAVVECLRVAITSGNHHHSRVVLVWAAHSPVQPGTHHLPGCWEPVLVGDSGVMVNRFGMHRFDQTDIIGNGGGVGNDFAERVPFCPCQ